MSKSAKKVVGAAAAATITAAAGLALAGPAAATSGGSSAYALTASGPVGINPVSQVSSSTKQTDSKSLLSTPANDLLEASGLSGKARSGHARAAVADLKSATAKLQASTVTATCTNGVGSSDLVNVVMGGEKLAASPSPNSSIKVDLGQLGTASLTLNKQTRDSAGRLNVTAIAVELPMGGQSQTINIASATCTEVIDDDDDNGDDNGDDSAPKPEAVEGDLPVTG